MKLITPEQAIQWFKNKGYIKLPTGSYLKWIEKDWFERYKPFLSFKNGAWIPRSDKLLEISSLDKAYAEYEFKKYGQEKIINEQMTTLIESEKAGGV